MSRHGYHFLPAKDEAFRRALDELIERHQNLVPNIPALPSTVIHSAVELFKHMEHEHIAAGLGDIDTSREAGDKEGLVELRPDTNDLLIAIKRNVWMYDTTMFNKRQIITAAIRNMSVLSDATLAKALGALYGTSVTRN